MTEVGREESERQLGYKVSIVLTNSSRCLICRLRIADCSTDTEIDSAYLKRNYRSVIAHTFSFSLSLRFDSRQDYTISLKFAKSNPDVIFEITILGSLSVTNISFDHFSLSNVHCEYYCAKSSLL